MALRTADLNQRNIELGKALKAADAAAEAKTEFLANMSHELRTPLNGVITAAALAQDQNRDESLNKFLKIIEDSGSTLMGVINDVLDFSKIEAGRLELEKETIMFTELVELVTAPFRGMVMDKDLRFRVDLDPRLPAGFRGDSLRLRQVLLNLVGNAVKCTGPGGAVDLGIRLNPGDAGTGDKLRFEVKDTGIGIPPEQQERLFVPFSQADGSITRRYGGTGLGLTISAKLVKQMGGEIGVESRQGEGALFFFDLDLYPAGDVSVQDPKPHFQAGAHGSLTGLRVLVAEDNQTNRELIKVILDQEGIQGVYVENGLEALKALERERYDLVLMDIQMPVMDGYSAVQRIRSRPEGRSLPVIAMTAFATQEDRERCLQAGMDEHVAKPIDREDLFDKVTRLVSAVTPGAENPGEDDPGEQSSSTRRRDPVEADESREGGDEELMIDREAARTRLGGLPETVMDELYRMFLEEGEQIMAWLEIHREDEEGTEKLEKIHNLKGMAANIGVNAVFQRARLLEAAWKEGRPGGEDYAELVRLWVATGEFLRPRII